MEARKEIKLIKFTQNPETMVALAARLCYSKSDLNELMEEIDSKDNSKFIQMLFEMGHLSTFEHISFTFLVKGVSRILLAQITRHRIASFSVQSQRYVPLNDFDYVIPKAIKEKGLENKFIEQMTKIKNWYNEWQEILGGNSEKSNEDARFVLPNACTTQFLLTMNARELLHFFELRCCQRAQWEIRELAWEMLAEVIKVAPNIFDKAGPNCIRGNCHEGKKSCGKSKEMQNKLMKVKKSI